MGTIFFTQTNQIIVCAQNTYCSARSISSGTARAFKAIYGFQNITVSTATVVFNPGETNVIGIFWECVVPPNTNWNAGSWTVNLWAFNVFGGSSINWVGVDICRLSSGCVNQSSIASSSFSINLNANGIYSTTLTGTTQTPSVGDKVMIMLSFTNTNATSVQSFDVSTTQIIFSPFTLYAFKNIPFRRNHR